LGWIEIGLFFFFYVVIMVSLYGFDKLTQIGSIYFFVLFYLIFFFNFIIQHWVNWELSFIIFLFAFYRVIQVWRFNSDRLELFFCHFLFDFFFNLILQY
jgi:hypothetical protein